MRDFKNMKRQRGRNRGGGSPSGGGGGKPQQNANRAFDSNGPDNVKIRGHAQHVFEKYQQFARDAFSSGDRVLAENYLQHADHYFRVLRTIQPQRPPSEILGRDVLASGLDIDFEEEFETAEEGGETPTESADAMNGEPPRAEPRREERYDRNEVRREGSDYREPRRDEREPRTDRYEPRQTDARQTDARQTDARQTDARQAEGRQNEGRAYEPRQYEPRQNDGGGYRERNEATYRDRQDRERQDGRGQDSRGQDGRGQDGRGQDGRGQEGRGQDGPRQDGRSQDGRDRPSRTDRFEPRRDNNPQRFEGRSDQRPFNRDARPDDRRPDDRRPLDAPTSDPLPVVAPMAAAQPFPTSTPDAEASPVLRSEDGGMSEAPAFLQSVGGEDGEARKPRARRRRAPRSFDASETPDGEGPRPPESDDA